MECSPSWECTPAKVETLENEPITVAMRAVQGEVWRSPESYGESRNAETIL